MRLVQTAVLEIELEEEGPPDGRPLLLLHGWPDAPRGWSPVAERLHERGWRTLVPALRGCGATRFRSPDAPRDGRGVALAADAVDLLDALGLECVPVVGHDWGARAAYTLAAIVPERVSAARRWMRAGPYGVSISIAMWQVLARVRSASHTCATW